MSENASSHFYFHHFYLSIPSKYISMPLIYTKAEQNFKRDEGICQTQQDP